MKHSMTRTVSYNLNEGWQIDTITGLALAFAGNGDRSISTRVIDSVHDNQEKIKPLTLYRASDYIVYMS